MESLKWKELFKALFLAGVIGYLSVAVSGSYWVGIPVLVLSGWLFCDFREKVIILKRVFMKELPQEINTFCVSFKRICWDNNNAKIYSFIIVPIFLFFGWTLLCLLVFPPTPSKEILAKIIICSYTVLSSFIGICVMNGYGTTDKKIGKFVVQLPKFLAWIVPKFIFWQVPKFLLKVIILTIYRVHSTELVAVSLYSLSGMLYILIFPPFQLAPTVIFLMAGGCGMFTGLCGLGMNKVLSLVLLQRVFVKVEAW